jgi:Protein of unknown function (DUF3040)
MPLSDHEQKLLQQMERALATEDPKFASTLRGSMNGRTTPKSVGIAVLSVVTGIGFMIAAVSLAMPLIGVTGFIAIVIGLSFAVSGNKAAPDQAARQDAKKPKPSTNFMLGLEDRWDRRQDTDK